MNVLADPASSVLLDRSAAENAIEIVVAFSTAEQEFPILNEVSGYIRFSDYAAAGGVRTDAPTAPARHPTGRPLRASRRAPADGLPAREDRPRPGRGTD